jgi:hypothetical protein
LLVCAPILIALALELRHWLRTVGGSDGLAMSPTELAEERWDTSS